MAGWKCSIQTMSVTVLATLYVYFFFLLVNVNACIRYSRNLPKKKLIHKTVHSKLRNSNFIQMQFKEEEGRITRSVGLNNSVTPHGHFGGFFLFLVNVESTCSVVTHRIFQSIISFENLQSQSFLFRLFIILQSLPRSCYFFCSLIACVTYLLHPIQCKL